MEEIIQTIIESVINTKTAFMLSTIFIIFDVISGYIKAFKNKNYNSSINREGLAKKMTWFMMLVMGVIVEFIIHTNILVIFIASCCITTEFMSIIENCYDMGVSFKITNYLDRTDD